MSKKYKVSVTFKCDPFTAKILMATYGLMKFALSDDFFKEMIGLGSNDHIDPAKHFDELFESGYTDDFECALDAYNDCLDVIFYEKSKEEIAATRNRLAGILENLDEIIAHA